MTLTEEMADDFETVEQLATTAENNLENGNEKEAKDAVREIKELAQAWQ